MSKKLKVVKKKDKIANNRVLNHLRQKTHQKI